MSNLCYSNFNVVDSRLRTSTNHRRTPSLTDGRQAGANELRRMVDMLRRNVGVNGGTTSLSVGLHVSFFIFFSLLLLPISVFAGGTSALQFLSLRAGARAESLGGAVTAIGDDLSSLAINPATISRIKYGETLFSQAFLYEEMKYSYLAYAQPTRWGCGSFEYMSMSYGQFDEVSYEGQNTGTQSPQDMFVGMGWSTNGKILPVENIAVGGLLRYVKSDLGGASANGLSFNLGGIYKMPVEGLTAGLSVNHLGSNLQYGNDSFSQPRTIRLGLGYTTEEFLAYTARAGFSLDGVIPRDGKTYVSGGMEVTLKNLVNLQVGYAGEESMDSRFRFGIGFGVEAIQLSYSAMPSGDLDTAHRVTARIRFGRGIWNLMKALSGTNLIEQDIQSAKEYENKGEMKRAIYYATKVLRKKPENVEAKEIVKGVETRERAKMAAEIYGEAIAYIRISMFSEAEEKLQQCIELDPANNNYQAVLTSVRVEMEKEQEKKKWENLRVALNSLENQFAEFGGKNLAEGSSDSVDRSADKSEMDSIVQRVKRALSEGNAGEANGALSEGKSLLNRMKLTSQGVEISSQSGFAPTGMTTVEASPSTTTAATLMAEVVPPIPAPPSSDNSEITLAETSMKQPVPTVTEGRVDAEQPKVQSVKTGRSGDIEIEYQRALQLMQERNLEEAIRSFREIVRKDKNYEKASEKLAECLKGRGVKHFARGRYEQSYADFQEALRFNSQDPTLKKFMKNVEQMMENLNYICTKTKFCVKE